MARIPLLPDGGLTPEQQVVYDRIVSGPRGRVVGPLRAALHSPELAERWQSFGEILRYGSSLTLRHSELAILICGRYWNSPLEWFIHSEIGMRAGLSNDLLAAMRAAKPPSFENETDAAIYEYSRQLVEFGHVDDAAYDVARRLLSDVGLVELTAIVGYYSMVAMTLNAHHVPLPDEDPNPLRHLETAAASKGGRTTPLPPVAAHAKPAEALKA